MKTLPQILLHIEETSSVLEDELAPVISIFNKILTGKSSDNFLKINYDKDEDGNFIPKEEDCDLVICNGIESFFPQQNYLKYINSSSDKCLVPLGNIDEEEISFSQHVVPEEYMYPVKTKWKTISDCFNTHNSHYNYSSEEDFCSLLPNELLFNLNPLDKKQHIGLCVKCICSLFKYRKILTRFGASSKVYFDGKLCSITSPITQQTSSERFQGLIRVNVLNQQDIIDFLLKKEDIDSWERLYEPLTQQRIKLYSSLYESSDQFECGKDIFEDMTSIVNIIKIMEKIESIRGKNGSK